MLMKTSLIVVVLTALLACEDQSSSTSSDPPIVVSATELIGDYRSNQVAADTKYTGKVVLVTGVVRYVGKDDGTPYVALEHDSHLLGSDVHCFFTDSHDNALAELSPGMTTTIKGKCDGFGPLSNVMVRGCTIRKPPK
jgi:hypothetical protein